MCGIVGYIGKEDSVEILLEGLSRLEYRGYDSSGIAVLDESGQTKIVRAVGKLHKLKSAVRENPLNGNPGIGHTRWATHGRPTEENAHPHKAGKVTVVHNGIIENYRQLKAELLDAGAKFSSETDTEIIAHLIDIGIASGKSAFEAFLEALNKIEGSYAVAVLVDDEPDFIMAARQSSPLVIGVGEGENFLASDIPAILSYTRQMLFMEDGDVAVLRRDSVQLFDLSGKPVSRQTKRIVWSAAMAEKEGYKHFMLKEIHEQPRAIADTLRGRLSLDSGRLFLEDSGITKELVNESERILIVACGTSYHAGLVGKQWIESFSRIPVEVDIGSEFRYRNPIINDKTLVIAISQSGETADTLAAVKASKEQGAKVISICNVLDSSIPRQSDGVLYTNAGPEIGVASTKAFTTQLTALYMVALFIGNARGVLSDEDMKEKVNALVHVPSLVEAALEFEDVIKEIADRFYRASDFLYLGRWLNYPIALEGALKLKEISYIHAEGYPAGEMKHGPIALIDENMPVVVIAPQDRVYEKIESNMEEAKARHGIIIGCGYDTDTRIRDKSDYFIPIPQVADETLTPIITVIPLQLLAYHVADFKGSDVDQPRNLAKSVTVE